MLEKGDYKCSSCGSIANLEYDHITRLSTSFGDQQFQALCPECHAQKTMDEGKEHGDPLQSHFNQNVWDNYVSSDRTPPLVFKNKELDNLEGLFIADVKRCRKRALEFNCRKIPIFGVFDDIKKRTENVLGDLNYVSKKYKCLCQTIGLHRRRMATSN